MVGFTLMLFIYWGWDTAVSVNEETKDRDKIPGRAAVMSTFILLATYAIVIMATQSYAGIGTHGHRAAPTRTTPATCCPCLGSSIFGTSGFGSFLTHLLLLMVLSSAAASTQTTILPTARTTLSMAVFKAIPRRLRQDPQAVPHADGVDAGHGGRLHRALRGHELPVQRQQRHRGLGVGPRGVDRLLLRADRVLLLLVLPQDPGRERPHPVAARHPAAARRPHPVVRHVLVLLVLLEPGQQLHHWTLPGTAPGHRRRLRPRRGRGASSAWC